MARRLVLCVPFFSIKSTSPWSTSLCLHSKSKVLRAHTCMCTRARGQRRGLGWAPACSGVDQVELQEAVKLGLQLLQLLPCMCSDKHSITAISLLLHFTRPCCGLHSHTALGCIGIWTRCIITPYAHVNGASHRPSTFFPKGLPLL